MYYLIEKLRGVAAITLLMGSTVLAQTSGSDRVCALARFDQEFRQSLAQDDAGRLALLVNYPLRVNDGRGSYYIKDPASLQGHLDEIFTPALRLAVASQKTDLSNCSTDQFMYNRGVVWVDATPQGYAIFAINVPTEDTRAEPAPQVKFACRTKSQRAIVDRLENGALRYRSWSQGRSLTQKPDEEISGGKESLEGTGACAHGIWSFQSGDQRVVIEEIGCGPQSDEPENAIGQLLISGEKGSEQSL